MSDPPLDRASDASAGPWFPPEYPYGSPAAGSAPPRSPSAGGDATRAGCAPPAWTAPPPPGFTVADPQVAAARAQAIAALIVAVLLTVPCLDVLAIPAIITSAVALSRARTDVRRARVLILASWIWIAISACLAVAFVTVVIAIAPS